MAQQSVEFGILENDVIGITEAQRTAEELIVGLSIVSEGTIEYKNLLWPRYENLYGKCQIMSGAYVLQSIPIRYINQELLHFQHLGLGIVDSVVCGFKAYGALDTPSVTIAPYIVLLRERMTSIRFRLRPGVLANITFQWDVFESKCNAEIRQPPGSQGKPPGAGNNGYNPGNRPGAQGGDPEDNSPNDGSATAPGQNDPPAPGGPNANASWKIQLQFFSNPPTCSPQTSIYNTNEGDPNAQITAFTEDVQPVENGCGTTVKRLRAFKSGADLNVPPAVRAPGTTVVGISYY